MSSLHSGKTPASAPNILINFSAERDLGVTPVRQRRDADANTILLALVAAQMPADAPIPLARQQEVTVLFCDIADYAKLAERVGPTMSYQLVSAVMESITTSVHNDAGRVVDYYGDGVLVLWTERTHERHAMLACQSALAIQAALPGLSEVWSAAAGVPLRLRCTLNTGPALVGNTGTPRYPKFGAVGHTINLAQRMQAAGKLFGAPIVVAASTRRQVIDTALVFRRLGWTRLSGLAEPTELYELHREDANWIARRDAFETSLAHFEARRWHDACRAFRKLLDGPDAQLDLASLHLLGRAIECLKSPPVTFDAVWELAGR